MGTYPISVNPLVEEYKYEEKRKNALIGPGEYISKKETRKISEKKTMFLYIVPVAPTLFYQQVNKNSCILSSLASALQYMGDEYELSCKTATSFWLH